MIKGSNKNLIWRAIFLLLILMNIASQAQQDLRFERISSEIVKFERGLSQNSVKCIYQDRSGYLWIGTWDGLNRYDGYTYKPYRSISSDNPYGLLYSSVTAVLESNDGLFWMGTEEGLTAYNRKTKKYRQFVHNQNNPNSLSHNQINALAQSRQGIIWIGTQEGLCYFDKTRNVVSRYLLPAISTGKKQTAVLAIVSDKKNRIWVATSMGLFLIDANGKLVNFLNSHNSSLCSDRVQCLYLNKNEQLWVGTNKGLNLYDIKNMSIITLREKLNEPPSTEDDVLAVYEDKSENVWMGTNGSGLIIYDRKKSKFSHYINQVENPASLSNDFVQCISPDVSGNIWIGTTWKGINKINLNSVRLNHYYHTTERNKSINNNLVWAIYAQDPKKLWIATEKGLSIFDSLSMSYTYMKHQADNPNSLASDQVRRITKDYKGNFWFGTFDSGIDKYNIKTKQFTHYKNIPGNPNTLSSNHINHILVDKAGLLWISTEDGLNCFDSEKNIFTVYRHQAALSTSISSNNISLVYEESDNILWVATYLGLNRFDKKTKQFTAYTYQLGNKNSISNDVVFGVYCDPKGFFWIGTYGGGLNKFNPKTNEFKHFTTKNGLANDVVYDIIGDKNGHLWMSTNYGLSRFNPIDESFINFDIRDGIQSYEYNLGACSQSSNGEMFFGGMNGFNSFYPEEISKNTFIPSIVITSIKVFDQVLETEFKHQDTLILGHNENFLSIAFSSLDFTNPQKNSYQYKLENFETNWNFTDASKHFAEYTKVPSGTYVFKVKGTNSNGVWNNQECQLIIIIKTPWWQSIWFRILIILSVCLLIFTFIFNRYRRIRKKNKLEKLLLEIEKQKFSFEQKALRLQMNPHFIFNSLTSIQSFILNNDTEKAINYLAKFAQLMRLILANSRESIVSLRNEINLLKNYIELEKLRFNEKFDFEIDIQAFIDDEFIGIPPMLIQPFIENAILHGLVNKTEGRGHLLLQIKLYNDNLNIIIEDNGVGRKKAAEMMEQSGIQRRSKGMLITQERIDQLNRQSDKKFTLKIVDLHDEQHNSTGTRIELTIQIEEI